MRKVAILIALVACAWIATAPAQAQVKTYVSKTGNDANDCLTQSAACLTFTRAITQAGAKGEVFCLDRGYFNTLPNITFSISIHCHGQLAQIGSNGFIINIAAGDIVDLDGIEIDFRGFPGPILQFSGAGTLHLRNSTIRYATTDGILFAPTGAAKLIITDSYISDNGSAGLAGGITIKPASGVTANVAIERTQITNNHFGIIADGSSGGSIRGIISDSFITGNTQNGITAATAGTSVTLTIDNTKVSGNNFGLVASGTNAGMLVRRSVVNSNATGLFTASGGVLLSYRDNSLNGNTTSDGVFTGPVGLQ